MNNKINRREFIKLGGISGAIIAALSYFSYQPPEDIIESGMLVTQSKVRQTNNVVEIWDSGKRICYMDSNGVIFYE